MFFYFVRAVFLKAEIPAEVPGQKIKSDDPRGFFNHYKYWSLMSQYVAGLTYFREACYYL